MKEPHTIFEFQSNLVPIKYEANLVHENRQIFSTILFCPSVL